MERICIKDKGYEPVKGGGSNYSMYVVEGWGISFNDIYDGEQSCHFLTDWSLSSQTKSYTGKSVKELLNTLSAVCKEYDLKAYNAHKKDYLVIYTPNNRLRDLWCYLYNYVTTTYLVDVNNCKGYFQVLDYIEFRDCWNKKPTTSKDIANWAETMWKHSFVPDKRLYMTSSQMSRKIVKSACKKDKVTLGEDIFPTSYPEYKFVKNSAHGGVSYCPCLGEDIKRPLIEIDLKSAYIYNYILPHCVSAGVVADVRGENQLSIGIYDITYSTTNSLVRCFKDIKRNSPVMTGEKVTGKFVLNNVAYDLFTSLITVYDITCSHLKVYDCDYLPKCYTDTLVNFFIKKETSTGGEKAVNKIATNAIYGNSIRDYKSIKEFKSDEKVFAPQWGSFIVAYCQKAIIELGTQLTGWVYSNTDSIFCDDTPENRKKVEEYNKQVQLTVKAFCDRNGYDFEVLKNLGSFEIKDEIVRFKSLAMGHYAYKTKSGEVIVKASGCNKEAIPTDDSIFEVEQMPTGVRQRYRTLVTKPHTLTIDGVTYYAETSYNAIYPDNANKLKWVRDFENLLYKAPKFTIDTTT